MKRYYENETNILIVNIQIDLFDDQSDIERINKLCFSKLTTCNLNHDEIQDYISSNNYKEVSLTRISELVYSFLSPEDLTFQNLIESGDYGNCSV